MIKKYTAESNICQYIIFHRVAHTPKIMMVHVQVEAETAVSFLSRSPIFGLFFLGNVRAMPRMKLFYASFLTTVQE